MTTATVNPTGDAYLSGVTLVGGATLTAVTTDVSDSTYGFATVNGSQARLDIGTVTIGGAQRVKRVRINVRQSFPSKIRHRLVDPTNLSASPVGSFEARATSPTMTAFSGADALTGPGGAAWTQALLDRVEVESTWFSGSSLWQMARLGKLSVDIELNTRPTVGIPSVSGMATTSRPAWSGVYADADGDPQVRAQVRVFTQAQAAAVGFSADTATPVWDSGVLSGAVTAGTVGVDLFSGTTYVLFWRAGQAWQDASGVWWSAWAASTAFMSSVNPPDPPVLTPTPRADVPACAVLLTADVPMDGTLTSADLGIERGDRFDAARGPALNWVPPQVATGGTSGLSTDGWSVTAGADRLTHEPVTAAWPDVVGAPGCVHWAVRSGTAAYLEIGADDPAGQPGALHFAAVEGELHTLSVWAWASAGFTGKLELAFYDGSLAAAGAATSSAAFAITTAPRRFVLSGTAPAGAVYASARVKNEAAVSNAEVYVTRVGFGSGPYPVDDHPGAAGPVEWVAVRRHGAGDALDTATDQNVVAVDREAPPGRPLIYRARMSGVLSGNRVTSAYSAQVTTLLPGPVSAVLKDPLDPSLATTVGELDGHDRQQNEDASTFHLAGRDGDPVVLRDWIGGLDGKVTLLAGSFAELRRLRDLYPSSRALLLQHPEGGQTYLRITSRQESPRLMAAGLHVVDLSYVEVGRP